jgi:hypothetical protein
MVLVQIATFKTTNIVNALTKWPPVEIFLFLSEILSCMPSEWSGSVVLSLLAIHQLNDLRCSLDSTCRQAMHIELQKVYMDRQGPGKHLRSDPLAMFIGKVAANGEVGCAAIADSGFVDMLMSMFLKTSPPIQTFHRQLESGSQNIELFCVSEQGCIELLETITVPLNCWSDEAYCQLTEARNVWRYGHRRWVLTSPPTSHGATLLVDCGNSTTFRFAMREREGGRMPLRQLHFGKECGY